MFVERPHLGLVAHMVMEGTCLICIFCVMFSCYFNALAFHGSVFTFSYVYIEESAHGFSLV